MRKSLPLEGKVVRKANRMMLSGESIYPLFVEAFILYPRVRRRLTAFQTAFLLTLSSFASSAPDIGAPLAAIFSKTFSHNSIGITDFDYTTVYLYCQPNVGDLVTISEIQKQLVAKGGVLWYNYINNIYAERR